MQRQTVRCAAACPCPLALFWFLPFFFSLLFYVFSFSFLIHRSPAGASSHVFASQSVSEKHYAAGFENYRTSKSSFLTGQHSSHATVRRTCQVVARLAETRHVEWPQLLRYDPGDWYV